MQKREQDGVEKIQAAVLIICARSAMRAVVDQDRDDKRLAFEIERLAEDIDHCLEKLRPEKAKLRSEHEADLSL